MCYGSVTWTLTQLAQQMLCSFERKIWRREYGPVQDKERWRPGWNSEICNLYQALNIVDDINIRRQGWAGHIWRIKDERIPEKVLNGKFRNTRPVGKPRSSWEDVVRRDTSEILGIRGWKRRTENRKEWRHLLIFVRLRRTGEDINNGSQMWRMKGFSGHRNNRFPCHELPDST